MCQLFRTNLQYKGNKIFIRNNRICVQSLRSRLEAIEEIQPPTMVKGCRIFAGMVKDLTDSINNVDDKMANSNPLIPDGTFHPGRVYRPPPKSIKQNMTHAQSSQSSNIDNNNSDINFDFKKKSPFQEGIKSEMFQ